MRKLKILFSKAHGGGDPGAMYKGHIEANEGSAITDQAASLLRKDGHKVDVIPGNPSLRWTINYIVSKGLWRKYDCIFEIHKNAGKGTGVEVLYRDKAAAAATKAAAMSKKIAITTGLTNRGALNEIKTPHKRLGFLHMGNVNAQFEFIIEAGFIDSIADSRVPVSKYAQGIRNAINKAFG